MNVKSVMALSALGHQRLVTDLFTPLDWEPHEDGVGLLGTLLCLQYSPKSWTENKGSWQTFELEDENLKGGRWVCGVCGFRYLHPKCVHLLQTVSHKP